ncbi:uncharacterized protein CIMG_08324 [Coccidioides immitis RS]|uniref:Short chain dehydrogenase/reductase n=4 Tax=Coccidioides immitis TaxID=5501 RepID=J3K595_COCIM|nr:uncharacterized protein CIMG_08324 [Coccidioides immitis RS]EAS29578.3 hypothetical protein CIMG_08324 [Coccidioides immitis RS]KMP06649.1 hypothetical protein CIRG_06329 [Coccidioides immitis RMSCC 2394]KMU73666.1 hypothetical protein CISG_03716 [Coccidioides immitis RMSCC 3703]KMU84227.1 hypothetical protein CIHG_02013 [Coccidioides immitis H538.4]
MTSITITDESLTGLKDKVVTISGGSSGIGLATAKLLLSLGARVSIGDLLPPPDDVLQADGLIFTPVDVTKWKDLCGWFRETKQKYGRIDHAFCNAGISHRADYFDERVDDDGDPLEPSRLTLEVNLMGVINMTKLAIWYMRKQESGGSIVITASASGMCFQRFGMVDYCASKHGVIGFMRGLVARDLYPGLSIRINSLAPAWTDTAIVPRALLEAVGWKVQSAEDVARSAVILMADESRHGQLIYSAEGKFLEIEEPILEATVKVIGASPETDTTKMAALRDKIRAAQRH